MNLYYLLLLWPLSWVIVGIVSGVVRDRPAPDYSQIVGVIILGPLAILFIVAAALVEIGERIGKKLR